MSILLTFGGRIILLHRSPVLCLLDNYKVTVYSIYGASFFFTPCCTCNYNSHKKTRKPNAIGLLKVACPFQKQPGFAYRKQIVIGPRFGLNPRAWLAPQEEAFPRAAWTMKRRHALW